MFDIVHAMLYNNMYTQHPAQIEANQQLAIANISYNLYTIIMIQTGHEDRQVKHAQIKKLVPNVYIETYKDERNIYKKYIDLHHKTCQTSVPSSKSSFAVTHESSLDDRILVKFKSQPPFSATGTCTGEQVILLLTKEIS